MPATTYTSTAPAIWPDAPSGAVSLPWTRVKVAVLAVATALAFMTRVGALATYGLSADEVNKIHAIEQYRLGHFSANAEHPMLMKLAMWGSVELAETWNRVAPADRTVPIETAIRLPNAIAGAAVTLALYGIATVLFSAPAAIVVSLIWAFDVNAIAINRIGKEDTFLLLFFLAAIFCYERAKRIGISNTNKAQHWYMASGAAFGLMLASKYMPHYLGIYALFNALTDRDPGSNKPNRFRHFAAMTAAFLVANPAIVLPETWRYMASYVRGDMLVHHGYLYNGVLYVTDVLFSPLGVPPTYYVRFLATRAPLAVLAAAVPGVIEMVRRRHERGFVLLRVLTVFLLVPYSLVAAKFLRYSLPMLATLDLIAAVGLVAGIGWLLRKRWLSAPTRVTVSVLAIVVFIVNIVWAQQSAAPFYSLFQNEIGVRVDGQRSTFPEETYDFGVREAVEAIAGAAAPSAVIVSDAPEVVAFYLRDRRRPDIGVRSLSADGVTDAAAETWVIAQDEHTTFENQLLVEQLRLRQAPWREYRAGHIRAAEVFRIGRR